MEHVLLLNANKQSKFDFDVEVNGVDSSKHVEVRFCFTAKDVMFCFVAEKEKKDKSTYVVTIPAMPYIEKTTHPFKIEVISDGYIFEALKGALNVSGDPLAHVTPKAPELKKETKAEEKKEEVKKVDTKKAEDKKEDKKVEEKPAKKKAVKEDQQDSIQPTTTKDPLSMSSTEQDELVKALLSKLEEQNKQEYKEPEIKAETKPAAIVKEQQPIITQPVIVETVQEVIDTKKHVDAEKEEKAKKILEAMAQKQRDQQPKSNILIKKKNVVER